MSKHETKGRTINTSNGVFVPLNERQRTCINELIREGLHGNTAASVVARIIDTRLIEIQEKKATAATPQ